MPRSIPFFQTSVDEADIANVTRVLRGNFLTTGAITGELESELAAYTGTSEAVGLTSGTAALHLCLDALGIGPGDEVVTTPLSFVATAHAVVHTGATPIFVDVDPDTGNIEPGQVEAAITKRTRAIMPVHLYGQMCDMSALAEIAVRHDLPIIEDAAHALESRRDGYGIGEHARAACLSFYATKNITSGEGGAVVTNDAELAGKLRRTRMHGMSAGAADRYTGRYRHYDVPEPGWKYNMSDIQAALLIGQLRRIDDLLKRRTAAYDRYERTFEDFEGVRLMRRLPGGRHACHMFTIQVAPENRDGFLHGMQQRGIGVAVNFRAIHLMQYYRKAFGHRPGQFPAAERIGASTVTLPLYPSIPVEDQEAVIGAAEDTLAELAHAAPLRPGA